MSLVKHMTFVTSW